MAHLGRRCTRRKKKKERLIIEISITSLPWGHQILTWLTDQPLPQYGSGPAQPRRLVINRVSDFDRKRFPPLPRIPHFVAEPHRPINILNNSPQKYQSWLVL